MKTLQQLFSSTDTYSDLLESDTGYIYDKLIEAVRDELIADKLLALRIGPESIKGDSIDVEIEDRNSAYVNLIAQGAEISAPGGSFTERTYKPKKYGAMPMITEELIEDGKFDLLDFQLRQVGYQMGRKLDTLVFQAIEDGAAANSTAHTVAAGGTAITDDNIISAMGFVEEDGYKCTDFVVSPQAIADIRNIDKFVDADKARVTDPSQRFIGRIFGMNVWESPNSYTTKTSYIVDKKYAVALAEKRPITVKNYDAVNRDMRGVAITARWDADYLYKEACAQITRT